MITSHVAEKSLELRQLWSMPLKLQPIFPFAAAVRFAEEAVVTILL